MGEVIQESDLSDILKDRESKSIVTLNGTFDILHVGHLKILREAKEQGDILIVGLNSDRSVKENKGPQRPINNQDDRAQMLAALDPVDYVVIFDDKDPRRLLDIIKPNIHVNGSEYGQDCLESDTIKKNGGKIHIVKLLPGHSTTKILQKHL